MALLTLFDFPAAHREHLRPSNPVESPRSFTRTSGLLALDRHSTVRTKRALSRKTVKLMVFTLVRAATKYWGRLKGANQLPRVIEGVKVTDGVADSDLAETSAA